MKIQALTAEPAELRKELPIPYILAYYGHDPVSEDSGRLHYTNPFRQDNRPSLDVFVNDKGEQRWGDFAEGTQGGVIDLIQRFEDCSSKEALILARQRYGDFLTGGWDGPVLKSEARKAVDPAEFWARLDAAQDAANSPILADLCAERPGLPGSGWLLSWGLRADGDTLLVPYFDRETSEVCGIRFRAADGSKWFAKGSKMVPYGTLRNGQNKVLLVEGETDCWAAHASLGNDYWVVSLPGVGHQPSKILGAKLDGLPVFVGFDPDRAGRDAAKTYAGYLQGRGNQVFYVPLPEGKDWASVPASLHQEIVERARPILAPPQDFVPTAQGYALQLAQSVKMVSNFTVIPDKVYRAENGAYWYRVHISPGHEVVTLPESALSSQKNLQAWASQHRRSWSGGSVDHTKLAALLQYESTFLPEGSHVTRPGLFKGTFAWPGHRVGPDDVVWVDNERIPGLPRMFQAPSRPEPHEVRALVQAYSMDVMAPMLGWLALAPLRTRYHRFPILFVTGRSGSGKTSLTAEVLRVFTGSQITTNLTSTTPYGVQTYYGLSNAFPVWFDEYRPGANKGALAALNQLIRDGYTGQPSVRGGLTNDLSKVTALPTDTPIVITGEDVADETSHRERMIRLYLDPKERGYLGAVEDTRANLMWDYLHFLTGSNLAGANFVEEPPHVEPWGPNELNDRQRWNLGIVRAGWDLFVQFCEEVYDLYDLPEPDWTQVVAGAVEDNDGDQVLDVLTYLWEQSESQAVWLDKFGQLCVSSGKVVEYASRHQETIRLPMTSAKALTQYLIKNFQGEDAKVYNPTTSKQVRAVRLPKTIVDVAASMGV